MSNRKFTILDRQELIKNSGAYREALLKASTASLADDKAIYAQCQTLQKEIDKLAGLLTGNEQHFHAKAHSNTAYMKPKDDGEKS